ncbi:hypothetical protein [Novosphingobium terrae]|uniref:hypothetical protein n=1 Tax=Novosphingobium terrae TaxID=2726189 RepID=UPI00197F04F5|nr:hypothetical protein [Novosphingobium terrae]
MVIPNDQASHPDGPAQARDEENPSTVRAKFLIRMQQLQTSLVAFHKGETAIGARIFRH